MELREKCEKYLKALNMNVEEKLRIEKLTRRQNQSPMWLEERRKRLTASNFGRICKAKSSKAKFNIINDITQDKKLNLPAIRYGRNHEDVAIIKYLEKYPCKYKKAGLFVHKVHSFLGGSPDGLIENDGIIEIKCSYKAKDKNFDQVTLDFLDSSNKLKITHNYYYQIQGLLEITNRPWCDFVVYMNQDIMIQRIERKPKFWANMLNKLRLLFLLLPAGTSDAKCLYR
uniref:YqaJ viral recombinase domain-containing protein n=1 Tax=Anoplophora glabripennis TaxID=217634 RepID=V5I921_ANOGL